MTAEIKRRGFLKMLGMASGTLAAPSFTTQAASSLTSLADKRAPAYQSYKDLWREQWRWDKVVRGTHLINCWYQAACSWDVYVRDGLVYREEQAAEYPQTNADVPDFNPRGCQKGCSFSQRIYDPTRIRYPLKRVGERGSNQWQRVSWDEALDDIAEKYLDTLLEDGSDCVIWDQGPGVDMGTTSAGFMRLANFTRAIILDMVSETGDSHRGAAETIGTCGGERSADDFFYSDLILIWGSNPVYTQIPNAHFFTEARYNGTKIITIAPDYNASATKSDLWVPIKPTTDGALAMGICQQLVQSGRIDKNFLREQTDMPLLVRTDSGDFLKESDVIAGGRDHRFYFMDDKTDKLTLAPFETLKLDGFIPRLDADTEVVLHTGEKVRVQSVFQQLKRSLREYSLDKVSKITGVSEGMIRRLTDEIANSKALSNVTSSTLTKMYHGNLIERAQMLVWALRGQYGHKGSGFSAFPFILGDGLEPFTATPDLASLKELHHKMHSIFVERMKQGDLAEQISYDIGASAFYPNSGLPFHTSGALFWMVHGGMTDLSKKDWDPYLQKDADQYLTEALDKGWQPLYPPKEKTPRLLFSISTNTVRRLRGSKHIVKKMWPHLMHVVMDFRMNSTTRYADYVLPSAAWYERTSSRWSTQLTPFYTLTTKATEPLGESKPDWEICALIAERIQQKARQRGLTRITNDYGEDIHLDKVYDLFSMGGMFGPKDDEKVAQALYELSSNVEQMPWEELKQKGFARYTGYGNAAFTAGNMTDIEPGETITQFTHHTRDKVPWATQTRRMQFYLDHPIYKEMQEQLPCHKDAPNVGGKFPLVMSSGHARESIHSTWRDNPLMLQLTRGQPFLCIGTEDAKLRGIEDGDWLRVYNDVGGYEVRAKLAPSTRPGQVIIYHAWEDHQFRKGSMRDVTPSPLNPVELAGDHPHLKIAFGWGQIGFFDRDTLVEVERLPTKAQ
ncbi:molybdopterin-dependent oxidoreductase [Pseudomaricurvus alkylphenolicus]|uniref:molybdopterin-dependent oxidoreductase n=1 Tax=Pseudomaricurvus alkylphenolicus TaxID=1306991 RepID=UPI00141D83CA|nr:molybdopterin-dependent oxidoreductase [Pseudomaricurvus alkylphenolicus]NIB41501.1 molybdopterin-dependent oxidoreductase [Pseudomaricurvus alkylphenolicus]